MKRTRAFQGSKKIFKGFSPLKVKRVLIPQNRKRTFSRLDLSPLKSVKSQVRKLHIIKGLKNDAPKRLATFSSFSSVPTSRLVVCKNRKERRKVIMSQTRGNGYRIKFAKWKETSKLKCN